MERDSPRIDLVFLTKWKEIDRFAFAFYRPSIYAFVSMSVKKVALFDAASR